MSPQESSLAALWFIVFLLSTTCHEAAHALVAHWGGDSTAAHAGQVSLNPMPHIRREPWGMVLVPLLSYFMFYSAATGGWMIGWASAPYDMRWRMAYPRRAGLMALAGPGANLALALGAFGLLVAGLTTGVFEVPLQGFRLDRVVEAPGGGLWSGAAAFLSILFTLNVVLCTFNLLPAPPLDGATAVGAILPPREARRWTELTLHPTFSMISLLVAWLLFPRYVVGPALHFALDLVYSLG